MRSIDISRTLAFALLCALCGALNGTRVAAQSPPSTRPSLAASASAIAAQIRYQRAVDSENEDLERKISQLRKQYTEAIDHARKSYVASLHEAITEETKKGRLDAALAIRDELANVEGVLRLHWPPILPDHPTPREEPPGENDPAGPAAGATDAALARLTLQQRAVARGLGFSKFSIPTEREFSYTKAEVHLNNTSPVGQVKDNVRARVRLLCLSADRKPIVLQYWSILKIAEKGEQELYLSGIDNSAIRFNNRNQWIPVNAQIVVYFDDVPVFQALWKPGDTVRWWDDESLVSKH